MTPMPSITVAIMLLLGTADLALVAERVFLGGGLREWVHGAGILVAPLFVAWCAGIADFAFRTGPRLSRERQRMWFLAGYAALLIIPVVAAQ